MDNVVDAGMGEVIVEKGGIPRVLNAASSDYNHITLQRSVFKALFHLITTSVTSTWEGDMPRLVAVVVRGMRRFPKDVIIQWHGCNILSHPLASSSPSSPPGMIHQP